MNFSKTSLLFFILSVMTLQANAQMSSDLFNFRKSEINYSQFTAILLEGEPLVKDNVPNGPLNLDPKSTGKLSVSTIDRSGDEMLPMHPIGFQIAIKNYRNNTIWMYSEEVFYEVDLEELLKECDMGDTVIFMTVDRKYQLPRYEVMFGGC